MELSGPDGKPMQKPEARRMPSRQEKFNMIYMMFTLMTQEERQKLIQSLRPLRRELDLRYPNGMNEGDMKNDLEKAANAVVPNPEDIAQPEATEVGAEQSVPAQLEGDPVGPEVAPLHEGAAK